MAEPSQKQGEDHTLVTIPNGTTSDTSPSKKAALVLAITSIPSCIICFSIPALIFACDKKAKNYDLKTSIHLSICAIIIGLFFFIVTIVTFDREQMPDQVQTAVLWPAN